MRVQPHAKMEGVYLVEREDGKTYLATRNLALGVRVYGEETVNVGGVEYRLWDPFRSKLAAAILKKMNVSFIRPGAKILYLGASTGTTVSHVSDIVGLNGKVFAVEIAARVMREFMSRVAAHRANVYPLFADARMPEVYRWIVGVVDAVYCDVAQPDETEIAVSNCLKMLRRKGALYLAVKARSIDATKPPEEIFEKETMKLTEFFEITEVKQLYPFDKDHVMVAAILK